VAQPLCFGEIGFTAPQRMLRALKLFNIQIHSDPLEYGSIARPERFGSTEEPAIAPLSIANSKAYLTGLASAQAG
jgi:hypothetical protein